MIACPFLTAAVLALGILATAPAMAGSRSTVQIDGHDNEVETVTHHGASLGVYIDGDNSAVKGRVVGPNSRAALTSVGRHTMTHVDVGGHDNWIATMTRSGGFIAVRVRGNEDRVVLHASSGSHIKVKMDCSRCYVRGNVQ